MKSIINCLLFCCLFTTSVLAQDKMPFIHGGFNLFSYTGDMGTFDKSGAGFHVGIQFNRKAKVNGAFIAGFGQVSDDDPTINPPNAIGITTPNSFFKTNFFFANYDLHYNIIKNEKLILYVSQGIGIMRFDPKDENQESLINNELTRAIDEDYRNSSMLFPTSIGIAYLFKQKAGLSLQTGIMNTITDYLDNISDFGDAKNDNILFTRISIMVPINLNQE